MSYRIMDRDVDEKFDTFEEAQERLMEEAYTYGDDFLEEAYQSYFPWKDLWEWCMKQESFLNEFGDTIWNAEQEFANDWITEDDDEEEE